MAIIEVKRVNKSYNKKQVLKDINITFEENKIYLNNSKIISSDEAEELLDKAYTVSGLTFCLLAYVVGIVINMIY